jgi:hypothetical protein
MIKCKRDNIDKAGLSPAPSSGKKKKKKKKKKARTPAFKTQKEFLAHLDQAEETEKSAGRYQLYQSIVFYSSAEFL